MESAAFLKLPCMNCKKEIDQTKAKIFQGVYVCDECYDLADRSFRKLQQELNHLLTLAGESIRLALIKGELQLGRVDTKEIPKSELIRKLVDLSNQSSRGS